MDRTGILEGGCPACGALLRAHWVPGAGAECHGCGRSIRVVLAGIRMTHAVTGETRGAWMLLFALEPSGAPA